jgi:predicted PurR-regulated permease PerM
MQSEESKTSVYNFEKIVDIVIRLGVLYMIISWCFDILKPFFTILIWGSLIAIAVYPLYNLIVKLFGGRKILASVVITITFMSILIVPSWLITDSIIKGLETIRQLHKDGQPLIPPPGEIVKSWPPFTKPLVDFWRLASENLQAATMKYQESFKAVGTFLLQSLASFGTSVIQFVASLILSGVLLIYTESIAKSMHKLFKKLAGENGEDFVALSIATVRNVFKGVLGVAFIQALLAGIGFFAAGVPYAGLWTIISLVLAIVQIGVGPVAIPIAIYMFSVTDTFTATMLAIWMIPVTISDNILRPILMGMGAPVPMLVIFMGSIGGFIYDGFIGLFLGAIVLSLGYKLFVAWIDKEEKAEEMDEAEKS